MPWTIGGGAVSSLAWLDSVSDVWQGIIALLGFGVLVLTLRAKQLEIRQRKRDLERR
jgi:hypothetical protein